MMTMYSKFTLFLTFLLLFGCSKNERVDELNTVNIFHNKNVISFTDENERTNARLEDITDIKEILNSKSQNLKNSSINYPFKKAWKLNTYQNIDDKNPYFPEPLFFSSKIYLLNNNGYLFKINSENGEIIWKKLIFKDLENTIMGTPAIAAKKTKNNTITLFAHNGSRELFAISGDEGEILWKNKRDLPFRGGITSYENLIFVNDFDGNFLSIDNKNGKILSNVFLGSDYNSVYTNSRPIVAKNKIIVPATGGTFFVISIKNSEVLWSENISSNRQLPKLYHTGDIVATPLYHQGKLYIVSQSGFTTAFDLDSARELWSIPVGGFETPVISGKTIYVMGNMGHLAAIDTSSGKLRWEKKFPSYINKNSFFSDEVIALYKGPTLVDSKILISNQKGIINIIDANNGSVINTLSVDELASPPFPIDQKILFLTKNGSLLAYK